ncbi:hypothetical protein BCR33DRAFT_740054 [Rhizoclosmatium globosum]|uniref:Uncharacterized protein n=1 Tax=Rhizoclosmatium globosum TaxID=329046 RepID=A0A1Y2C233_9FUNG|nr:hypothetical protein BCR33DRAFT_740054 [Rhizoclosmatium globosum]|eukprot:ORY41103.1 hypothetical protein BCR33DRAFT_740054 [Rhizoclosmatium globosum]
MASKFKRHLKLKKAKCRKARHTNQHQKQLSSKQPTNDQRTNVLAPTHVLALPPTQTIEASDAPQHKVKCEPRNCFDNIDIDIALTSPEQSRLPRSTSLASPGPSARSPSPAHLSSASSVGSTIHYRKLSGALLTPPSSSTTTTDGVRKLSMANQPTCAPPPLVMRSVSHAVSQRRPSLAHSSFPSLARVLASYQLPALTAGFLSRGQANYFAVLQTSSAEIPALVFYSATRHSLFLV